ncbi:hypothetical protein M426DRAFT_27031 [Hypoxylon sp. CI-4A]|nr:hypothetical protein M426DRAFT_27031 [Hypoxylon sp. CI-4A]
MSLARQRESAIPMVQMSPVKFMPQVEFQTSTTIQWYSQNKWESVNHGEFIDHLNREEHYQSNQNHQFHVNMVMLKAQGYTGISITRDHFQLLLNKLEIPASSAETLFHRDGRHTYTPQYSQQRPGGSPISLCIAMQTPSLELEPDSVLPRDSLSMLLRVSPQQRTAACIIIARDPKPRPNRTFVENNHTSGKNIGRKLEDNYSLIEACPLYIPNILCGQLDSLNEEYWNLRETFFMQIRQRMDFCQNWRNLYEDNGMGIFRHIHGLNSLRRKLIALDHAMKFELSALHFSETIMAAYQKLQPDGKEPQALQATLETLRERNKGLETAVSLRQARREGLDKWAELDIDITVTGSNVFDVDDYNIGYGAKVWKNWWVLLVVSVGLTAVVLMASHLYRGWKRSKALSIMTSSKEHRCPRNRYGSQGMELMDT